MKYVHLFSLLSLFQLLGQQSFDTIYFNSKSERCTKDQMQYYYVPISEPGRIKILEYYKTNEVRAKYYCDTIKPFQINGIYQSFYTSGALYVECTYVVGKKEGTYKSFHPDSTLLCQSAYRKDFLQGELEEYNEKGKITYREKYSRGKLIEGTAFDSAGNEIKYTKKDVDPIFPGGARALSKFLKENLVYPKNALLNGIEGVVQVAFVVNKDGKISEVKIINSVSAELDAEAIRAVSLMPDWKPGYYRGRIVRTRMKIPITFSKM